MAPTICRDTRYSLMHLIEEIKHGKIALPDIQRPFVWSSAQVRDLFDSLYRGYLVGTLMFWETGADAGVRQAGGGENDGVARLLIVDGQQRLTSLFAVLTGRSVLTSRYQQKRIGIPPKIVLAFGSIRALTTGSGQTQDETNRWRITFRVMGYPPEGATRDCC